MDRHIHTHTDRTDSTTSTADVGGNNTDIHVVSQAESPSKSWPASSRHNYPTSFVSCLKVVPYSVWRSNFVLTILAVWQIGGHSFSAVWKALFLSIGQIVGELELPPLNMNN